MMTYKQEMDIKSLFSKKEYERTPNVVYFTITDSREVSGDVAEDIIQYLQSCPDKPEKTEEEKRESERYAYAYRRLRGRI